MIRTLRLTRALVRGTCLAALTAAGSATAADNRVVQADPGLRAGWLQRWLVGADYRALWQEPIEVEVLDLRTFAGGLTPRFRVGGQQTLGLALRGADGKSYTFRGIVKDLSTTLPPDLREFLIDDIVQDQLAAAHPVGPLLVAPLAGAAGVAQTTPALVIMPDDPVLGEFRDTFAGALGTLEEYPTAKSDEHPGFLGAEEIVSSQDLWRRLVADPAQRADATAYLRARLVDFLVGDWDRHPNQWRWAKLPERAKWQPIPEDRDQAFSSYEGLVLSLFRPFQPKFVRFTEDYPSPLALTLQGWEIDRWLLAELDRGAWVEVADDLRRRLSDETIDAAVRRMPAAYRARSQDELAQKLKQRRDELTAFAERTYAFLAREVDVQGTDHSERVVLDTGDDGSVSVTLTPAGGAAEPYFARRFGAGETQSIRIYLRGGADELVCTGSTPPRAEIFVVGETGTDATEGCADRAITFMDVAEFERRQTSPGEQQASNKDERDRPLWRRARDWGTRVVPIYRVAVSSSLGLVLGGGVSAQRYQFAKVPFGHSHALQGAYSFGIDAAELSYSGTYQHWHPQLRSRLAISASGLKQARFHGFGNDTEDDGDGDFFRTEQTLYTIAPSLQYAASPRLKLFAGGRMRYSSTDDDEDTLLNQLGPYGVGEFGEIGAFAGAGYDSRDPGPLYAPGFRARATATWVPALWDVDSDYGSVAGEAAGYYSVTDDLMLSARVAGEQVYGTFPFHSAAYLGDNTALRGYSSNRFAGDASVVVNSELRYTLGFAPALFFRGEWGVFVFADAGRVWFDDDDSASWHPAGGGGVSLATLERTLLASLTIARSEEGTSFFFLSGFSF